MSREILRQNERAVSSERRASPNSIPIDLEDTRIGGRIEM
jgi:hypothetical protein